MGLNCAKWLEAAVCPVTSKSAEAMTAPRPREQRRPPSPPDRPPPRRGGHTSPYTCAASAADRPAGPAHLAGARRGLVRSVRALAAVALLALSGALPVPAQAQTSCTLNTGDIWCAVVTVGEYLEGERPFAYGFVEQFSVGDLSDDSGDKSFTYGTNSYTVDSANVGLEDANRALTFSLTGALTDEDRSKLVLHVGSKSFPFGTAVNGSAHGNYSWLSSGLDWSLATSVTLRLRDDPPPPPANLTASPGDRRVTLAWDAPAADARVSRHEFRYKWRTTGDYGRWQAIPDSARGGGNASGYTTTKPSDYPATGYPNLIDHVFQVRAVNAAGESEPSNETAVAPLHPEGPPAPMVSAPTGTAGLLEVSWTAVASASAYEVRYWPADEDGRLFRTKWTRDTSALIQPLAANTEYRVSVAAQGGSVVGGGDGAHRGGTVGPAGAEPASARRQRQRDRRGRHHRGRNRPLPGSRRRTFATTTTGATPLCSATSGSASTWRGTVTRRTRRLRGILAGRSR